MYIWKSVGPRTALRDSTDYKSFEGIESTFNYDLCVIEKEFSYQVVNLYPNTVVVVMQILQQDLMV